MLSLASSLRGIYTRGGSAICLFVQKHHFESYQTRHRAVACPPTGFSGQFPAVGRRGNEKEGRGGKRGGEGSEIGPKRVGWVRP